MEIHIQLHAHTHTHPHTHVCLSVCPQALIPKLATLNLTNKDLDK